MIIDRADLYEILKFQLRSEYSIGLHGITASKLLNGYGNTEYDVGEFVHRAAKCIMQDGLQIYRGRTINGTVAFFG